jgi:hypothetical protein
MKNFDLKQLSKGMHINDKLRLLFADLNKQSETESREIILTPQEKDALLDDAKKRGEYREIRRVMNLFKTCTLMLIDLEIIHLSTLLVITTLEKILIGIILKGVTEEIVDQMIHDWSAGETKAVEKLRSKYKIDHVLMKGFDYFSETREVNKDLEKYFLISCKYIRRLNKKLYEIDYVTNKSPVEFLSDYSRNLINESRNLINLFIRLDAPLKFLRIYRDYGTVLTNNLNFNNSEFYKTIKNLDNNLRMDESEKQKIMAEVDRDLKKEL